ncbi:MAG: pyrimidine-nucleoside phosphorylase [Lactococcus raffinolactis]|jgi:pyrimidine-nucleoside phosphorylase|uniref:Pyrimidine-nucleoside phosphorylase n=1 Tax=Pseudolactococcus raffinolactis TaxID=1366 RepID=A0AAE6YMA6_9LACT|nr:pyrimidine-nucleoside phosphorylase [Lactococcus raffinolactis]MBP6301237.1 pyrimidine-nucleoside phosphorylase [Lactococcus sp.]ATC60452.1 pyrimidine-nucleoside phosphorylase [Lactococcus raffinolactis]MBR2542769.1 pyrimidine-nucleoside phosphorylase [Lactococcus sp.]MBW9298751.1 pyrimidine-nucleoside phosphorylase [Lactococcus raffinolactis]MBW9330245.1 pyrimidine-nucleoside phosphorylase [Lactococcus raffinolactis]
MRMIDIIQKKRDGLALTKAETTWLIDQYATGQIPDYQMSAWAMAVYFQGMTKEEIADLTMAMVATGEQIDLSEIPGVKVDKHSTGGVGDKVTLILAPLVASFGISVAKMSGRGLGHTGGTIDKLESIHGFQVERSQADFVQQVKDIGISVIGQSDNLVKADKLLYALRDVTATVDIIPLIASSIMSKKIAAGSDAILLDVTVGSGAFMKNLTDARLLAQTMVDLGNAVGRKTVAVITDMRQPLGATIGNRLEIAESLTVLQGGGSPELRQFIAELAQIMLGLAGVEKSVDAILENLSNGTALDKFKQMIQAQDGDLEELLASPEHETVFSKTVVSRQAGYVTSFDALTAGLLAMRAGAGRAVKSDVLDLDAGLRIFKKIGDRVESGEPLFEILYNKADFDAEKESQVLLDAISISDEKIEIKEIVEIIK